MKKVPNYRNVQKEGGGGGFFETLRSVGLALEGTKKSTGNSILPPLLYEHVITEEKTSRNFSPNILLNNWNLPVLEHTTKKKARQLNFQKLNFKTLSEENKFYSGEREIERGVYKNDIRVYIISCTFCKLLISNKQ